MLIRKITLSGCVNTQDNTFRGGVNTQDNTLPWMDFPGGFSPKQGGGVIDSVIDSTHNEDHGFGTNSVKIFP